MFKDLYESIQQNKYGLREDADVTAEFISFAEPEADECPECPECCDAVTEETAQGLTLIDGAYYAACALNDFKHVHLHACGADFSKLHDLAEEYYIRISSDVDYLCEASMQCEDGVVQNLNKAATIISYEPIEDDAIEFSTGVVYLKSIIDAYVNILKDIRGRGDEGIQSSIDNMIDYWAKEAQYKLERTQMGAVTTEVEDDIASELDTYSYGEYDIVPTDEECYVVYENKIVESFSTTKEAEEYIDSL